MDIEIVLTIIVTAAVTLGAVYFRDILDDRKRLKEIRREKADVVMEEISFVTYYLDNLWNMINEANKLMDRIGEKSPEELDVPEMESSIYMMSRFMTPSEIMKYSELFDVDPRKAMLYLFSTLAYDLSKFRNTIVEIRKKSSGFSLYFSSETSEIIANTMDEFYRIIDEEINYDVPNQENYNEAVEKLEQTIIELRDVIKEEVE